MIRRALASLEARLGPRLRAELAARERPGRALAVRPDDRFVVSFPKSGNTWVRFLIATLLHPESPTDFGNLDARVPTIYGATARALAALPGPRVLKSHEYFDPRYRVAIGVVRDPRDVVLSYHQHWVRKGFVAAERPLADFVADFLAGRVGEFGSWGENVGSWLGARGDDPDFLLVRYEDLQRDGAGQLARIAHHLGLAPDAATLTRVVEACAFDKMAALERAAAAPASVLAKATRDDVPFVRRGKVGGWRDDLAPDLAAAIADRWRPLLERLGYAP